MEFGFQPKIDLRRKQLAGTEAFARMRHPEHGILPPGSFMGGADDAALLTLAEQGLVSALKFGLNRLRLNVHRRIAVNMPVAALVELPVGDIVRVYRPQVTNWPGLVIDIIEQQAISEIAGHRADQAAVGAQRAPRHRRLRQRLCLTDEDEGTPFAEMKLDLSFVTGVGNDKMHAPICKTVIDLAHSFGSLAVGVGIESASDATAAQHGVRSRPGLPARRTDAGAALYLVAEAAGDGPPDRSAASAGAANRLTRGPKRPFGRLSGSRGCGD
jgi:EAL domain-containing protein (putative c-di-GMP-specific phosphodiesterase class I)